MSDNERDLERKRIKAARERARYQAARQAGLSPKQAKSIRKTLEKNPELAAKIPDVSPTLASRIENLDELLKPKKKKQPQVKFKEKKPLTDYQRRLNKEAGAFKRFLNKHPDLTMTEATRQWRSMGHSMSTERAAAIYREKKGQPKRNGFARYGADTNPGTISYFKARYNYIMGYTVLVSGTGEDEERFMTLPSHTKLTKRERVQAVMDAYDQGELDQNEYYAAIYLYEDSIHTVYMVDNQKKSNAFKKFEAAMLAENPDLKENMIIREWRKRKRGK